MSSCSLLYGEQAHILEVWKKFLDLNPISHWGHLTLFWPPNFRDEFFPVAMNRPQKYFQTLTLIVTGVIYPYFGHPTF